MSNTMTMMFEVEDLAVASPATVSRCGMIYLEPHARGFEPLLNSYIQRLSKDLRQVGEDTIRDLFWKVCNPCIQHVTKKLKQTVSTTQDNMVLGTFNIMDALMAGFAKNEGTELSTEDKMRAKQVIS